MKFKIQILLIISISLLVGYFFGVNKVSYEWKNATPKISVVNKQPASVARDVDLTPFWDVWQRVGSMYYDKKAIDSQKMLNGAIQGMVSSVGDPYTVYLPPVQNNSFQQQLAGKFEGIGAELGVKDNRIIVVAPLDGSPAQKAGIRAGDSIVKVNNTFIEGWSLAQAVEKIRGPKGTQVKLGILHKGDKKITDITITRDTITVKSVTGWVKKIKEIDEVSDKLKKDHAEAKVMYVRLSQFGDKTNQDWAALVEKLYIEAEQRGNNLSGMVFDLRNNPGGYLEDAVFVASEFLKDGTPVVIQDAGNGDKKILSVNRAGNVLELPVIVLINGGSASASEIVAGALRDRNRAKLVGETSFGKGTIQQSVDLGQGAGLHVTIAKWLTPKETWVHQKGLTPDIKVSLDEKDPSHDAQLEAAIDTLL